MGFGLGLRRGSWVLSSGGVGLLLRVRRWLSCGVIRVGFTPRFLYEFGYPKISPRIGLPEKLTPNVVMRKILYESVCGYKLLDSNVAFWAVEV